MTAHSLTKKREKDEIYRAYNEEEGLEMVTLTGYTDDQRCGEEQRVKFLAS